MFLIVSEISIGTVRLGVESELTVSGIATAGTLCGSGLTFLSNISTSTANEYFSKIRVRYTKLRDWINVITLLYENTLKESRIDK